MRDWSARNKEKVRASRARRIYGMTVDEYDALVEAHAGVCAICGKPETQVHAATGRVQELAVDHDHGTGKVRGLLCVRCNSMLGRAGDSTDVLRAAIIYLERNGVA